MKDKIKQILKDRIWKNAKNDMAGFYETELLDLVNDVVSDLGLSNEWVSVDDSKPGFNQCVDVWVYINAGYNQGDSSRLENVFYIKGKDCWCYYDDNTEFKIIEGLTVTHWQPLPLPPKESGE